MDLTSPSRLPRDSQGSQGREKGQGCPRTNTQTGNSLGCLIKDGTGAGQGRGFRKQKLLGSVWAKTQGQLQDGGKVWKERQQGGE